MKKRSDYLYDRFIEKTNIIDFPHHKSDTVKGFVDFNRNTARKPFVEEPKDYSSRKGKTFKKKRKVFSTSPDTTHFTDFPVKRVGKRLKLYDKDRELWNHLIEPIANNNNLEYEPDKELTMKKLSRGVPIFSKMSEKSIFSPTFSEFTKIEPKVPQTKKNIVPMDKSLGRDMKMYRRTEAYDN
eukprot:CAMPEP_0197013944 /NCGR_PEP_ID=MMETSP1380-20130617/68258_1 /TAXON_ID=5936 /ORGANISM="Euplotes crassus, Strain CT5" /LENGTH=182 /DNA_ID=CAMNT_0042438563 /DNA_START=406 /DNA_END=951 /DNA_ORIENTATION=-